jgi:hypothetical protein
MTFKQNILHLEHTRLLPLCHSIKGLDLNSALAELKWDRRPIASFMTNALAEAIVKAKESGYDLKKTYVADAHADNKNAVFSKQLLKKYIRGRGRYGAIPHAKTGSLEFILQERTKGFEAREKDEMEWIRQKLRSKHVVDVEAVYQQKRQNRPIKAIFN